MPVYTATKPVTAKPRGRVGSRPLSLDWRVRKDNARLAIQRLRELAWTNGDALDKAAERLDVLTHSQSNKEHQRVFHMISLYLAAALGVADYRVTDIAPMAAKPSIDINDPPIGLHFLIGENAFVIRSHTPGTYPGHSTITGYWAHTPDTEVTLDSTQYGTALHIASTTYGYNLAGYLKKYHAQANRLSTGRTYYPTRSDYRRSPSYYTIQEFLGLNHMRVRTDVKPYNRVITVRQWKLWNTRTKKGKSG